MSRTGWQRACAVLIVAATMLLAEGCHRDPPDHVQGYVEGEFIYVAAPLPGALEKLQVRRGEQVEAGQQLFTLDHRLEQAAYQEAERRLVQARATVEDAKKGLRPSEIDALEAQLAQARSALEFSETEFQRLERLVRSDAAARPEFDRARTTRDQDRHRIARLEADLQTASLGARADQIAASEANVRALEAALAAAEWNLSQKSQAAPQAGLVFDTLYRQGEWVGAGRPVVALLPPANIKVRAFVPEPRVGMLHHGDVVQVLVDGVGAPLPGRISYISPQAEYTPPVIYSNESRSKLVFMIEATFAPEVAATLHPGQPVDVQLHR